MTFRDWMIARCLTRGMTPSEALRVADAVVAEPDHPMRDRWDHGIERYPPLILEIVGRNVDRIVEELRIRDVSSMN
jgi:hypothetical protein